MRKFLSMASLSLALALFGTGAATAAPGDTGKGGASCTFAKCMDNCKKAAGVQCARYCERILPERRQDGTCKS